MRKFPHRVPLRLLRRNVTSNIHAQSYVEIRIGIDINSVVMDHIYGVVEVVTDDLRVLTPYGKFADAS